MQELKTTPLTSWHRENGAKMAPFAGYDMPVQYEGILAEHRQTRESASVFDICHMGEFTLEGPGAAEALDGLVTQDVRKLAPGRCGYGFLLNPKAGVLDDLIVYRRGPDRYLIVVNAACEDSDFVWMSQRLPQSLALTNISAKTAKIDLQGPRSREVLEDALGEDCGRLPYFGFAETGFQNAWLLISRTGYTGELGYELYLPSDAALDLWRTLVGHPLARPAGLGARDTLRLEMGYPLYGQDLDPEHTPVEAGYGRLLGKAAPFLGKPALGRVNERLIPLLIDGRRAARHNDRVLLPSGAEVGAVTSGSFAPSLSCCVALAYVRADAAEEPAFRIAAQRAELDARRATLPFYTQGTARNPLD
ncbi:MAG: glycine cleavage system aminomethyltransferase GcvT [Desulfovibrionaceae bacterium]|nr:glycine cleavage system aminomethyltransferase GcvT [Desulfovibrionaceae bacterium]